MTDIRKRTHIIHERWIKQDPGEDPDTTADEWTVHGVIKTSEEIVPERGAANYIKG
ncbi:Hypothetical protein CINCED_3A017316 [Cinara cedri]|uniref:Uncharacterized protein n=1 Tax=Cinara cedri TaxID=506608 RepID=A0A5E4MP50_9HEMI|nr:Hypothetical protein CINCED_3A017316 [Cinara cedri]